MPDHLDFVHQLSTSQTLLQQIADRVEELCAEPDPILAEAIAQLSQSLNTMQETIQYTYPCMAHLLPEQYQVDALHPHCRNGFAFSLLDQIGIGLAQADPFTRRFMFVSDAYCSITGYSRDELLNLTINDINHPDDQERDHEMVSWIIDNPMTLYQTEKRYRRNDGRVVWVSATGSVIRDEDGRPLRMFAIVQDISDRKQIEAERQQAEADLRQREQWFRNMADHAPVMIYMCDATGACTYASQSWYTFSGQTPETTLGFGWMDAVHPADREDTYGAFLAAVQRQEAFKFEYRFRRHDGDYRWFIDAATPWLGLDGDFKGYIGSVVDISDRKQLEESLKTSQAQLKQILNSAIASIISLRVTENRDWEYEYFSAGCEQIFGYTPQELMADKNLWMSRVYPEDLETSLMPLLDVFYAEGKATAEYRFYCKDGTLRWISSSYSSQQIFCDCWIVTIVNNDITRRKQMELELQKQIQQEYLLADMAQDIRRSLDFNTVLSSTVQRVRDVLKADRVSIFKFDADYQGEVIMESVGDEWPSMREIRIYDTCFREKYAEAYRQGRVLALNNFHEGEFEPCYMELMQHFHVRASLVVPILQGETLWGLLIAHQCSAPRQWQPAEIAMLQRLATQVGIAIQQSELFEQMRQELTTRQQMQAVLEENEERFRTLSIASPIGICQTNADGLCLFTNARWQWISGLSQGESLGDGWLSAVHPDDSAAVRASWDAYLKGTGTWIREFRLLSTSGKMRWVSTRAAAMRGLTGNIIGYVVTFSNITFLKDVEAALRKSQQQLQAILDNSPAAIYMLDRDQRHILVNRFYADILGTTPADLVGKSNHDVWPTAIADSFVANNRQVLETGELLQVEEMTPQADGLHTYFTIKFPMLDETGTPYAVCGISTDITERKQMEAQFYRAQRLESVGTLAGGIAHDLNNLLTPIMVMSQLLRMTVPHLDEAALERINLIEDGARRGADMVKQLLDFTRGHNEDPVPVDVAALLRDVCAILRQSFPKSITIHYNAPRPERFEPSLAPVLADLTQLQQVVMNFCVNARDAMPTGGTLTLSARNCEVDASFAISHLDAQPGNYVAIAVTDTGTGIAPEVCDRIFDPFFTTKDIGEGTGLGLSTVLGIIQTRGGFITVDTEVGQGTTMTVYLPALDSPFTDTNASDATAAVLNPLQGQGEVVLVVDDDQAVQRTLQTLLESHQYQTLTAKNGDEAIALYTQHHDAIRLVIMDVMMPTMGGEELMRQLKEIDVNVRAIAISGLPTNRDLMLAAGAQVFMCKPYTLDDLLATVRTVLG